MSTAKRILDLSPEKREALNALLQRGANVSNRAIARRNLSKEIPLSPAQERLWFAEQWQPGRAAYHLSAAIPMEPDADQETVRRTLSEILRRHEILRTTFRMNGTGPVQDIRPDIEPDIRVVHIPAEGNAWRTDLGLLATAESRVPFDLACGPLLRAVLYTGRRDSLLLITLHHLVADGWSLEILFREFKAIYRAYRAGAASPLEEPAIQYADFALWQMEALTAGDSIRKQWDYWERQLAGLPVLQLPTDRPCPAQMSLQGSRVSFLISAGTLDKLRDFNRRAGATMNMTLLAAFTILLRRYSGQDEIVLGSPIAGRSRPEIERLIGFFVNVLVLRVDLGGHPSFRECLARVRKVLLEAIANQDVPFAQLAQRFQTDRDRSRNPFFQVTFQFFTGAEAGVTPESSLGGSLQIDRGAAMFDLVFNLWESTGGIEGRIEYSSDLFDRESVARMSRHFETLLESMLADPEQCIDTMPLLTAAEAAELLRFSRSADLVASHFQCAHELVETRAAQSPERIAVVCQGESMTYAELNARANRLARGLRASGVTTGAPVAISLPRTCDLIVALLGVMKAGGAYVPIDPQYPAERIDYIREDAQALAQISGSPETWPAIDDDSNLNVSVTQHDLAYIVYTSGSTGLPKGVEIEHGSLMNLLQWHNMHYRVSADDRASQVASISFDAAVWEIWPYLISGAALYIAEDETRGDPEQMLAWLRAQKITLCFLPTPLAEAVLRLPSPGDLALRELLTGGDRLRFRPKKRLAFRLTNHYGPTENTVVSTYAEVVPASDDASDPPIGRPIANVRLYICDEFMQPVPVGVPGEIYVGGPGLGRGYRGRTNLTLERFVRDPFDGGDGRLFRTGDLGRFRHDGNVEFLGRRDRQLKIRGFRIEPGEIESAILSHPGVREAVIAPRETAGGMQLVAYFSGEALGRDDVAEYLRQRLPEYMIPSAFIELPRLPLTANGKIDFEALPGSPPAIDTQLDGSIAGPLEPALTEIWKGLLHVDSVGRHQDFFADFGGHSLLTVALVSRIREACGIEISPRMIFEAPTVAKLACRLESMQVSGDRAWGRIARRALPDRAPCSFAQQRLWFLDRLTPGNCFYNIPAALRMDTCIDPATLERAVGLLARRHEALRTTFPEIDSEPVQHIHTELKIPVTVTDLREMPEHLREGEALRIATLEARTAFDLARGPLLRVSVVQLAESSAILLVTMHHIISDGWSTEIFFRELAALYEAELFGTPARLPDLAIQYGDYADWQHRRWSGGLLSSQAEYWKTQIAGTPLLRLPTDRPRADLASYRGSRETLRINGKVSAALKELSRFQNVTLFMTLLAAFETVLYRYSGQDDFAIGTITAGRDRAETEGLIGLFANVLPLRADVKNNPSFSEMLARVRETALDAFSHAEFPFEKLVEELRPERDLGRNPLVQVTFQLFNQPIRTAGARAAGSGQLEIDREIATFDIAFDIWESDDELTGYLEYSTDLFDSGTIRRILSSFTLILASVADDPENRVDDLPLLTEAEVHRAIVEWNDTTRPYPECCIHRLFELQAARTPDRIAVTGDFGELTYRQLESRASQIAEDLYERGAGPSTVVGVSLERSPELIVALLAVLKSGAAFLPVDPHYPFERNEKLLREANAQIVITKSGLRGGTPGKNVQPPSPVTLSDLAYVLYTSGSTGQPKAVAVEHRSLTNHALGIVERFNITPADRVLQFASPSFDVGLEEIFPTLLAGASVVVRPPGAALPPRELTAFMRRMGVTIVNLPSPYWHEWVDSDQCGNVPETLRLLIIGSDRTDPLRVARWRQVNGTRPRIIHAYGTTECTITSLTYEVCGDLSILPFGRPLPNVSAYILDRRLRPVPIGVAGNLYIGGAGVARGYEHRECENFTDSPFGEGRIYRTGDRARYLPDGNVVFAGREDDQVKIRGFRVEPAEIESELRRIPEIRDAAVVLDTNSRLVAYVISANALWPGEVLARLKSILPEYMLPQSIVQVAEFPRTPSGKLDVNKLKAGNGRNGSVPQVLTEFASETEKTIAQIWRDTLNIDCVEPGDNFFELGGHSLALLRVHGRVETAMQRQISIVDLFRYPTIHSLAKFLRSEAQTR